MALFGLIVTHSFLRGQIICDTIKSRLTRARSLALRPFPAFSFRQIPKNSEGRSVSVENKIYKFAALDSRATSGLHSNQSRILAGWIWQDPHNNLNDLAFSRAFERRVCRCQRTLGASCVLPPEVRSIAAAWGIPRARTCRVDPVYSLGNVRGIKPSRAAAGLSDDSG